MRSTGAVILAAGLASRFGGRKLLAPIGGRPMLQHVLDLAADSDVQHVVAVLGADAAEVEAACAWRDEIRVINPSPEEGLAGSVRVGLRALEATDADRVVVLLGDQPFLSSAQLAAVLAERGEVVVPRYSGVPGNPVVIDRLLWPLVASLEGDRGFSQLFDARRDLVTYVDVPGRNPDIDTREDLDALTRA